MEMYIVHYQTNILYSLQLVAKKYKCQLEYLFWVMGIMFYEIQRPTWPVAIRDRIRRPLSGNGRGFYFPKLYMSWMQEDVKHWGYGHNLIGVYLGQKYMFVWNLSSSSYPSFYPYVLNILFHLIFLYIFFIIIIV